MRLRIGLRAQGCTDGGRGSKLSTIRNGHPAAPSGLQCSLAHWAYFALLRPQGARFVRPPPLPSSIRNGRSASCAKRTSGPPLLIGLTTACFRHRRRPSCAPLQFPLKSYGFPGAETARKRFLLWKMRFSGAKIAPPPPYTPPGTILMREGFVPQFTMGALHLRTVPSSAARCSAPADFASLCVLGAPVASRPPISHRAVFGGPVFRPSRVLLGVFDSLGLRAQGCAGPSF